MSSNGEAKAEHGNKIVVHLTITRSHDLNELSRACNFRPVRLGEPAIQSIDHPAVTAETGGVFLRQVSSMMSSQALTSYWPS
jgi:hypothetical protein